MGDRAATSDAVTPPTHQLSGAAAGQEPQPKHFRLWGFPTSTRRDEPKHGELLKALTVNLVDTYSRCSTGFKYQPTLAPKRVLTKLSKSAYNLGYDNVEHDYICRVGDKIVDPDGNAYEILDRLGHGSFGQVLKCSPSYGSQSIALKIIKNKPAYFHQALVEVRILQMLNQEFDAEDEKRIVRMFDFFVYRKHLCIAFELLSLNLYDVLKQNSFRGVSLALIRVLTEQLLTAMQCLRKASVIHCDLKPENVLLSTTQTTRIKLIDFGSACFENNTVYSYIQSRFYRSPEVQLGLPYTTAIDMWSLGCICAELYMGLPIFPGATEYDQICRIVEVMGLPPERMLELGKNTRRYFSRVGGSDGTAARRQSLEEFPEFDPRSRRRDTVEEPHNSQGQSPSSPSGAGRQAQVAEVRHAVPTSAEEERATEEGPTEDPASKADGGGNDSGAEHRKQHPARDGFLDLVKRTLLMEVEDGGSNAQPPPSAAAPPSAPPSAPGESCGGGGRGKGGGRGGAGSDSCQSAGSTMSTAADTYDVVHRSWSGSGEKEAPHGGSPDASKERTLGGSGAAEASSGSGDLGLGSATAKRVAGRRGRRSSNASSNGKAWRLKTREEYEQSENKKEPVPKKYFNFNSLVYMMENVPYKSNPSRRSKEEQERDIKEERERRQCFLQFLEGVLQLNPDERWTPMQAAQLPFITGKPHDPDFRPPDDEPVQTFAKAKQPRRHLIEEVPRLPPEVLCACPRCQAAKAAPGPVAAGAPTSGNRSARTWRENTVGAQCEAEQPRSAPATGRGVGGRSMYVGVPSLPESYRPPIDKWPVQTQDMCSISPVAKSQKGGPQKVGGAWSVSTASTSSTGSTPTGGHGGPRGVASPRSSAGLSAKVQDARKAPSQSDGAPARLQVPGPPGGGGPPQRTAPAGGPVVQTRTSSRNSSPWHLPSPPSEMSTASDRMNSSQPSGSDSCTERLSYEGAQCNFDGCTYEDPSQSDTPHYPRSNQLSDSDFESSSRSHDASGSARGDEDRSKAHRPVDVWKSIKLEMTRVGQLGRLDISQSPAGAGAAGGFREAVGMNETGPVILRHEPRSDVAAGPRGAGPALRNAQSSGAGSIGR